MVGEVGTRFFDFGFLDAHPYADQAFLLLPATRVWGGAPLCGFKTIHEKDTKIAHTNVRIF